MEMQRAMVTMVVWSAVLLMPHWRGVVEADGFRCPIAFWTFGDSLSDTGNAQAIFPSLTALNSPYGMSFTFRDKPGRNRYSDGRLIVDFVAQAFHHPFYGTYAHVLNAANYIRGANFANAGATANATAPITPFHLNLQVQLFLNFKSVALSPNYPQGPNQPLLGILPQLAFSEGAYYIPEIGGNDFFVGTIYAALPASTVIAAFVPAAATSVRTAITTLHASGGRLFFLGNTPPQGCNPAQLTIFSSGSKDTLGCVDSINSINRAYAAALQQVVSDLQASFGSDGTNIYYFDFYTATIEILTNPSTYGFTNTKQSCCGAGGPYKWSPSTTCGEGGVGACATPGSYVHWDGIHYTEAFYRQIATFFLEGRFVSPPLNLKAECQLDFDDFYKTSS